MLNQLSDVEIRDRFWDEWLRRMKDVTLPRQYQWLKETGRLDNFRHVADGQGEFRGRFYDDSDVYKWLEAASSLLAREDDPNLRKRIEETVSTVEAAQGDDGYLHTYFMLEAPGDRWENLGMLHELYCAGHLIEAAVAHYRTTDSERLLNVARRFADHIDDVFGETERNGVPGHEEIELALVKLYRTTGEDRYLDLAAYFVDRRGRDDSRLRWEFEHLDDVPGMTYNPGVDATDKYRDHMVDDDGTYGGEYAQDHRPVREQERPVGHAVRALYLYAAMTDLAAELDDEELRAAVERLWERMTSRRMYVTGGVGSSYRNEGFTKDYDLPNETAYAETCAAVGNVFWNDRLARFTGDARYADVVERALYNGVLSGVSVDGERFRYLNPLARTDGPHPLSDVDPGKYDPERFSYEPQDWFTCACCPSNVARLLTSLHRYVYAHDDETLYVNLYVGSEADATIGDATVSVHQETEYPWSGSAFFAVSTSESEQFVLALRIPDWARAPTVEVNGTDRAVPVTDGYAKVDRVWEEGDTVEVAFELPVQQVESHPQVRQTTNKVALQRGPIVYCFEERDNRYSPHELRVGMRSSFKPRDEPEVFNGVTTITGTAFTPNSESWDGLYRPRGTGTWNATEAVGIPYYAWGQRDDGEMAVWLPKR